MTVNLRSLRIAPDFDATRYVAGIAQKNAAERETVQASLQAGKASEDLKIKVSSTIPVIERLSRTYIDGYGTAQKFNAEILKLARTQDSNASSAAQLEQIYAGLQRRFGLVADAQELAQRGYTGLAAAIANVNEQLAVQDNTPRESALAARSQQLRAAFDADFVAAQRLTSELNDLAEAERLGVALSGGYENALASLIERHDAAAAAARRQREEYARLAEEGRASQRADGNQAAFNSVLGLDRPRSSARDSAAVFQEEMVRLDQEIARREELNRLRASQDGAAFASALNQRLVPSADTGSARDSAAVFQQEFARLEEMQRLFAQQAGAAFTADLNTRLGVDGFGTSARASAAAFEEAAREAESLQKSATALRAQIDPLGAAQARLNGELAEYNMLAERGQITSVELAQAQALARSRFEATKAALDAANDPAAISHRELNGLNVANAGFQLQDIAVTAAMGMNPGTIGLQQGLQLAGAVGSMEKPVAGIAAAFGSLLSPVTLATVGLTAAAAAAIQFGMGLAGAEDDTKKLDKALERHEGTLKLLETRYGSLIDKAKGYSAEGIRLLRFQTDSDIRGLRNATKVAGEDFFSEVGGVAIGGVNRGQYVADGDVFGPGYKTFNDAITKLRREFKDGRPDFEAFYESLYRTAALDPKFAKKADELAKLVQQFREGSQAVQEMERVQRTLVANQRGVLINSPQQDEYFDYLDQQRLSLGLMQREFDAQIANIGARTPTEKADAARRSEEAKDISGETPAVRAKRIELAATLALTRAERELKETQAQRSRQFDADMASMRAKSPQEKADAARLQAGVQLVDGESTSARQERIDLAGTKARIEAEYQLSEAQRERARSMAEGIRQQETEIAVIGRTVGQVTELQTQYSLLSQLREEAARNGITSESEFQRVFSNEIELINQTAAAHGRLAEARARLSLANDLQFERDQLFRSDRDQQIAQRQRGAGLQVDLTSPEALVMRQNIELAQLRDGIKGFFTDFRSGLQQGESIGEAFANALMNGLMKAGNRLMDNAIDSLLNSLLGSVADKSTGLLQNAASAGGTVGSSVSSARAIAQAAVPANDNAMGSALSFIGNYKTGVDARLTDILDTAAKQFPGFKVEAMSGYRPGDPRFHGQGLATDVQLTDLASGKMLGNYQDASSFRQYEQFAQTARAVQMQKYPELSEEFRWGGYFGGGKGKYGAVDTMHFDLGGKRVGMGGGSWAGGLNSAQRAMWPGAQSAGMDADTAAAAVERMAANTNEAATNLSGLTTAASSAVQGMGNFGAGLGQVSQQIMSALSGANNPGGSLLGGLGSLFGGISPTSSFWAPNTTLGSFLLTGKAGGGYTGPGGVTEPAGVVHKGEIVWSQMDIARAGGVAAVEGMRLGWRGYADGGLVGAPSRRSTIPDAANDHGRMGWGGMMKIAVVSRMQKDGNLRTFVEGVSWEKAQQAAGDAVFESQRTENDRMDARDRNDRKRPAKWN